MKISKKILSIVLALTLILATVGVGFTSFAAASDTQVTALADALTNENVANALFSFDGTKVTVTDDTGDIAKAAAAYYAVFKATYKSSAAHGDANRTAVQVNDTIKNLVQTKVNASDFDAYNMGSVLGSFIANAAVDGSDKLSTAPSVADIVVTVNVSDKAVCVYDSLDDFNASDKIYNSYSYTIKHSSNSWQEGSGCGATTYYYARLSSVAETPAATYKDLQALFDLNDAVNASIEWFDMSFENLVDAESTDRMDCYDEIKAPADKVSEMLCNHFFADYNVKKLLSDLESAESIAAFTALANEIKLACETDYSAYTIEQLETLYNTILTKLTAYETDATAVAKEYIEAHGFDVDAVEDYMAALLHEIEVIRLNELKTVMDASYEEFNAYDEDKIADGTVTTAMISAACGTVNGYFTALGTYVPSTVAEVFSDEYLAKFETLRDVKLADLAVISGYNDTFAAKYAYFTGTVYAAVNVADDSEELLANVKAYDNWFTELKTFCIEVKTVLGEETANKIFKTYSEEMQSNLDSRYNALNTRLDNQVNTAYDLLTKIINVYGDEVTTVSVSTFGKLKTAIGYIEKDVYGFLDTTANYELDAVLKAKYEELCARVFDEYNAFIDCAGYDFFEQTFMDDITRLVSDKDIARDKDYTVTDEKLEELIDRIDTAFNSDEVKALLADSEEDTSGLAGKLHALIGDAVYSDSLINTLVGFLYPTIANEFVKIWADLPTDLSGMDAGGISIKSGSLQIVPVETAVGYVGINLFPTNLVDTLKDSYPEAAEKLAAVTTAAYYDKENDVLTSPWEDPALLNEDGDLDLYWGVDDAVDKKAAFLDAATAALSGLEQLFVTLLCNKPLEIKDVTGPEDAPLGKGSISVSVLVTIDITLNSIKLTLSADANAGYNNVIIPILETLGLDPAYIPDGNSFTTLRQILENGLVDPVSAFIDQLAAAPLNTLTKALPNLAYALELGRIVPLLSMLKSNINYKAGVNSYKVEGSLGSLVQGLINSLAGGALDEVISDKVEINVGEMLDLDDLGIDLTSLSGLLEAVGGLIAGDEEDTEDTEEAAPAIALPPIEGGKLATLGTLAFKDTKRNAKTYTYGPEDQVAYIEANRADVLVFVLNYLAGALGDENLLPALLAAFAEEGEEPAELSDTVKTIIGNVSTQTSDVIAALTELVFPADYEFTSTIEWKDIESIETEPVLYSEYWTEEKATYVSENLASFIDNALTITGIKVNGVKMDGLGETIEGLLTGLYTAETVNSLAEKLAGLIAGLDIKDSLKTLITDLLRTSFNLDITYWDNYNADFEDGDKDAFKAALADVLSPLTVLLQFILVNEDVDIRVTTPEGLEKVFEVKGNDGYANGLIPLLETLGAQKVLTPAELAADKDNIVSNIIDMLFSVVDYVEADPYQAVADLLPSILYYLYSDGLTVAIDNLLFPVNVVLDTIRPIYDVNIYSLLDFDLRFAETDPVEFLFTKVAALIYDATGIDFKFDFTTEDLLSSVNFGEKVAYTSANGQTAYRIVNSPEASSELITTTLRYVLSQFVFSENAVKYADMAKEAFDLDDTAYAFLYSFLYTFRDLHDTHPDYVLGIIFWVFYGADTAVDAVAEYYKYYAYDWAEIVAEMSNSDTPYVNKAGYIMKNVYNTTFTPLFDDIAEAQGLDFGTAEVTDFFKTIRDFFKLFTEIFNWIKGLFA